VKSTWWGGPFDGAEVEHVGVYEFTWRPELNGKLLPPLRGQIYDKGGLLLWRDVTWTPLKRR
jgi:hypothetical protein